MKIRSITCFCHPGNADFKNTLVRIKELAEYCMAEFQKKGWETQTCRLATTPFSWFTSGKNRVNKIHALEEQAERYGINYVSIGPARLSHIHEYNQIPEILAGTKNVFVNTFLTHPHQGISMAAVRASAQAIKSAASISPDGFDNLRFCAMSLVKPYTPFFPAAYSYSPRPAFALAMECADAAVNAFAEAKALSEGKDYLLGSLNSAAEVLATVAVHASQRYQIPFLGFDFSLAPFPQDWCSIGNALEALGVQQLGYIGSMTCAAILMDTLDSGKWKRTGFNGLMLPLLEDSRLAARSESPSFTIKDLLLYSAVCGTGLDTVPLPGNIPEEQIEALLMDIAALSLRLRKPLTARLMPIPGLKAGDLTRFDFEFFHNGHVLNFPAAQIGGLMTEAEWVQIRNREIGY